MNKNSLSENLHSSIQRAVNSEHRLSFLCPHHRDWVYFNSQEALEHLDQMQLKGEFLLEHQRWTQALPLIGSAWETSEILLQLYSGEKTFLVNRLCCLTVLLSNCMERLGHKDCAQKVCEQTRQGLTNLAQQFEADSEHRLYLSRCVEQLKSPERLKLYLLPWPQTVVPTQLH